MNDLTIVWIVGFGFIYLFFYQNKEQLWKQVGSIMFFINGIIGVEIADSIITSYIMYITLIIMVIETIKTIRIVTRQ